MLWMLWTAAKCEGLGKITERRKLRHSELAASFVNRSRGKISRAASPRGTRSIALYLEIETPCHGMLWDNTIVTRNPFKEWLRLRISVNILHRDRFDL